MQWIKSTDKEPSKKGFYTVKGLNNQGNPVDHTDKDQIWFTGKTWIIREGCKVTEWLEEKQSPSPTTDLSKVFDEEADVLSSVTKIDDLGLEYESRVDAMSKPRFISTVQKLLDAKTVDIQLPAFSEFLINEINSYQKMRDGWKEGCSNYEGYDLAIRVLRTVKDNFIKLYCESAQPVQTDASGLIDKCIEELLERVRVAKEADNWKVDSYRCYFEGIEEACIKINQSK